jgi:hypothetical protein
MSGSDKNIRDHKTSIFVFLQPESVRVFKHLPISLVFVPSFRGCLPVCLTSRYD